MGGLLFTQEIKQQLINELSTIENSIKIVSAFCKTHILQLIDDNLPPDIRDKQLLVRFKMEDIVSGVTDFSLYDYCIKHGWSVFLKFDLHAKTYIFDDIRGIVGSCNSTSRGLGFSSSYNCEIASLVALSKEDIEKIQRLFNKSVKMNDEIYSQMKEELKDIDKSKKQLISWSKEIKDICIPDISTLFTHQFPAKPFSENLNDNDYVFLELPEIFNSEELIEYFKNSLPYLWLKDKLTNASRNQLYFGTLTEMLHNTLVNDPKPYRKDVKELLANLLDWIKKLHIDEIIIEQPNHSQLVTLKTVLCCI